MSIESMVDHSRAETLRVLSHVQDLRTPSVVYSRHALTTAAQGLSDAVSAVFGSRGAVAFSTKCNPRTEILEQLAAEGCSFIAAWPRDVQHLLRLGVPATSIFWSGPLKRATDISAMRRARIVPVVESPSQFASVLLGCAEPGDHDVIGIRLHFTERSRFGVTIEDLSPHLRSVKAHGISRVGFQVHGLAGPWPPPCAHWAERAAAANRGHELADKFGLEVAFVSLGGGLPEPSEPAREAYMEAALPYLAAAHQVMSPVPRVLVEPGRFLVQWSGTMVASVVDVRHRRDAVHVILDLSFTSLASPTSTELAPVLLADGDRGPDRDLLFVGPSDFHGDLLCRAAGPVPNAGDLVAFPRVGAYQEAFAAHRAEPQLRIVTI